jgi:hypothetical protein
MSKLKELKKLEAYYKKNKTLFDMVSPDLEYKLQAKIQWAFVEEELGIPLPLASSLQTHTKFRNTDLEFIGFYGKDAGSISWEVNDKTPDNEWLYVIRFPTGAYFFGQEYPITLFKEFFNELIALNPKYLDVANSSLYFGKENAKVAYEAFPEILSRYKKRYKDEEDLRELKRLQQQVEDLQKKLTTTEEK